jgi:hypothetical protein
MIGGLDDQEEASGQEGIVGGWSRSGSDRGIHRATIHDACTERVTIQHGIRNGILGQRALGESAKCGVRAVPELPQVGHAR